MITVIANEFEGETYYYSLNNRRLYTLKKLRNLGLLKDNCARVRIKIALAREKERYTIDRCSLEATIMKEYNSEDPNTELVLLNEVASLRIETEIDMGKSAATNGGGWAISNSSSQSVLREGENIANITSKDADRNSSSDGKMRVKSRANSKMVPSNAASGTRTGIIGAEASLFVKKNRSDIEKMLKKGKMGQKEAISRIDEFCDQNSLDEVQRSLLCSQLGIEKF